MFDLLQPTHLLFVLVVALVVFGPKRLMEMSRELGRFFRRIQEYKEELQDELTSPPTKEGAEEKQPPTTTSTTDKR